jgi:hypothetical protein
MGGRLLSHADSRRKPLRTAGSGSLPEMSDPGNASEPHSKDAKLLEVLCSNYANSINSLR